MRSTSHFVLFCTVLAFSHALSLPQATPLPRKRGIGNSTDTNTLANTTASGGGFEIKAKAGEGTITMDLGPLSAFTPTTSSLPSLTGTGYIIYPTNYNDLTQIPPGGMTIVFGQTTQQDLLAAFKSGCDPDNLSDPACIEGLADILEAQAPDLQKRFFLAIPVLAGLIAAQAIVIALLAELMNNSAQPVPLIHYESSVLAAVSDVSTATSASVILVETTTSGPQAITISTTELTSFNPSPTASASPNGTGLLISDSSGHFVLQIQGSDIAAIQSAGAAMASPAPNCSTGTSPLVERDDTDSYDEALCLADELMYNADGLANPDGLMSTFRTQIVEVAGNLDPTNFIPNFEDVRVAGAFGLFLLATDTLLPTLFPGLAQQGWLVAAFLSFSLIMLPLASNTQGQLKTVSGTAQIVLQVTKGSTSSQPICAPTEQPYNCESVLCAGKANICTGDWLKGCPCVTCPAPADMPSCDDCNAADPTSGTCATVNPGCTCYIDTMQNSNAEDPTWSTQALQIWNSLASLTSTKSLPYNEGVTCRPDNYWYAGCQYPNTETGSQNGSNVDFESCLDSFSRPGNPDSINYNELPNPTWPANGVMNSGSTNVTMMCLTNKNTVNFIVNVAYAPGCISPTSRVSILDPIGDGSIDGLDVLRGNYYGCLDMAATSSSNTVDMVPGSAARGSQVVSSSLPIPETLYAGASNSGVGGWNQVGCLIYDVIPVKNNIKISVNGKYPIYFQGANWGFYQTYWPTLAKLYYDQGGYYCPVPSKLNANAPPPCGGFPCSLGSAGSSLNAIHNLIQT